MTGQSFRSYNTRIGSAWHERLSVPKVVAFIFLLALTLIFPHFHFETSLLAVTSQSVALPQKTS